MPSSTRGGSGVNPGRVAALPVDGEQWTVNRMRAAMEGVADFCPGAQPPATAFSSIVHRLSKEQPGRMHICREERRPLGALGQRR